MNNKIEIEDIIQLISEIVSDYITQEKSLGDCNNVGKSDLF